MTRLDYEKDMDLWYLEIDQSQPIVLTTKELETLGWIIATSLEAKERTDAETTL